MYLNDTSSGCGCDGKVALRGSSGRAASCGCGCDGHQCDGLTCTCRPRFFDGQLITARDFGRLDRYLVDKSRLHNRYLHGVGVVCGLEVVCNPCDDTVTVRTGYALGPCGEDVVVCSDTRVDVAALIRDHRRGRERADCPPYGERPIECEAAQQKWILGICYDEHPAGGVSSLRQPATDCGCGGSGGCTGSCGGGCGGRQTTPAACEPTQICEGFRFTLTKVDPGRPRSTGDKGSTSQFGPDELPSRVLACLTRMQEMVTKVPQNPTVGDLVTYCCQLKADLRDLIDTGNVHDCRLDQRLNAVVCPAPEDQEAAKKAQAAIAELLAIAIALFRMCVCSALLPPCSVGSDDDCVPLAVLNVRTADLQVLDICNWSARKFALTMPTLGYWFGWIPVFDIVRASIERLCCQPDRRFQLDEKLKVSPVKAHAGTPGRPKAAAPAQPRAAGGGTPIPPAQAPAFLLAQYAGGRSGMSGFDATVLGAIGAQDPAGADLATPLELGNPLAALAVGRLGFDAFDELIPGALRGGRPGTPGDSSDRIQKLEAQLTKLQKKVTAQDRLIRKLEREEPDQ